MATTESTIGTTHRSPVPSPRPSLTSSLGDGRKTRRSCKLCGSVSLERLYRNHNKHSPTSPLTTARCKHCGLVFVQDQISETEATLAYTTLDHHNYYAEIAETNNAKLNSSAHDLLRHVEPSAPIIDIGTGDGCFLGVLRSYGFVHLSAHDIPGTDLSALESQGIKTYKDVDLTSVPSNTFAAATLLDVAEHVVEPRCLFEQCYRILTDVGLLYFHTPVISLLDEAMQGLHCIPLLRRVGAVWQKGRTNIFHLQNYTPNAIRLVLSKVGFVNIKIRVCNELSWPIERYIRAHLCENQGMPEILTPLVTAALRPFLTSNLVNRNKAVVVAWKRRTL